MENNIDVLPKAISFNLFKSQSHLEKYTITTSNTKHKIALCRLRISSHDLMIEKGRHFKPKLERDDRKCPYCV